MTGWSRFTNRIAKHTTRSSASLIQIGLDLCGQKNLDEIADAVGKAAEGSGRPRSDRLEAAFIDAAFAIKGAERCRLNLDAEAIVDHLQAQGAKLSTIKTVLEPYLALTASVVSERSKAEFCLLLIESRFGPGGLGFVSE